MKIQGLCVLMCFPPAEFRGALISISGPLG